MLFHADRHTGGNLFATYFDSLTHIARNERAAAVCGLLQITPQTLARYLKQQREPPAPFVGLLWHESPYGREALDEHSHRGMLYARGEAEALKEKNARLLAIIARLESELDQARKAGNTARPIAANAGVYRVA